MSLKFVRGDIFKVDADVIVNPVNCVGVMGAGLALAFKNKYPRMFKKYQELCKSKELVIGNPVMSYQERKILLFPTKNHWKDKSRLEEIDLGLKTFVEEYGNYNIKSIAFPALGCGLGGLRVEDVKELFVKHFEDKSLEVIVFIS